MVTLNLAPCEGHSAASHARDTYTSCIYMKSNVQNAEEWNCTMLCEGFECSSLQNKEVQDPAIIF